MVDECICKKDEESTMGCTTYSGVKIGDNAEVGCNTGCNTGVEVGTN